MLGRYRLLERLGTGGFGVVWRARDELLHREVAVKRIALAREGDGERPTREALAAARLAHPAIVALYEACAEQDAFYLISELVRGDTLARLVASRALTDREILQIGVALADALSHAHSRGVIHRDVKPQNVLVGKPLGEPAPTPDGLLGVAKLTDFGGAHLAGEDLLTRTGDVLGTLAYMAPEQCEGGEVDGAADLYSLALVLYEALCGTNPVRGPTPAATARRIGCSLAPLHGRRGDLPRALTRAIDTALDPRPASRGTLQDLRLALEKTLEHGSGRFPGRRPRGEIALEDHVPPSPQEAGLPQRAALPHRPTLARASSAVPESPAPPARRRRVARRVWLACALAAIVWQAWVGRSGVALLALAAVVPLAAFPSGRGAEGPRPRWPACALAPVLGLVGLAGAFPAIAGQALRWSERAALGAVGYWWLTLAEPALGRDLWLGQPPGTPARAVWEGSLTSSAVHVVAPMLSLGVLLGAGLWASGAVALPWLVRGRRAALDVVAATAWSAALVTAAPLLEGGLSAHPSPRGVVLGAILGAMLAVAARALRGPV